MTIEQVCVFIFMAAVGLGSLVISIEILAQALRNR
jgi:hypothetical protein